MLIIIKAKCIELLHLIFGIDCKLPFSQVNIPNNNFKNGIYNIISNSKSNDIILLDKFK